MTAGVVFDLDETLIDRQASIVRYARRFYRDFQNHIAASETAFLARFVVLDGNGYVPRETFFQALADYVASLALDSSHVADHFIEHAWRRPVLMTGASPTLHALRDAALPIGVVTNGGSLNQRKKLRNAGIESLIDYVVISEELGARKPEPAIFLEACNRLGIDPAVSWFVGDHPRFDIHGAAQVGFRTIWLQRAVPWPEGLAPCYEYQADTPGAVAGIVLSCAGLPKTEPE